jgi:hypothetical protein
MCVRAIRGFHPRLFTFGPYGAGERRSSHSLVALSPIVFSIETAIGISILDKSDRFHRSPPFGRQ